MSAPNQQDNEMNQNQLLSEALAATDAVSALIKHQYTGTSIGMTDLQIASDLCDAVSPKIRAALAQPADAVDEPFGYFRAEPFGWTDCAPTDEGAVALYERPQPAQPAEGGEVCNVKSSAGLIRPGKVDAWVANHYITPPAPKQPMTQDEITHLESCWYGSVTQIVRWVEAHHGITSAKETP